jgi:hypothetical protein
VILIGTRFRGHVYDHAACLPEFRGVITGLIGYFLNRICVRLGHLRIIGGTPQHTIGCVQTIDAHCLYQAVGATGKTVDRKSLSGDGIIRDTGQDRQRVVRIPVTVRTRVDRPDTQNRSIVELLQGDVVRLLAGFGLQQRSFGLDGHGLRGGAYLQRDVFP